MDCSIFFSSFLCFLYVLDRSILSVYLLLPLERERQDNMKQPRLATSSKIKLLSSSHTPPMNPPLPSPLPLHPQIPFFLPPPFIGILHFLPFPFLSYSPSSNLPHIYIHTYQSLESKKKNHVNPTFERFFFSFPFLSFFSLFYLFLFIFLSFYLSIFFFFFLFPIIQFFDSRLFVCIDKVIRYFLPLPYLLTSYLSYLLSPFSF